MIAQENVIKKLHNKTCATTLVKERNVVCYHFCNMNALHSYRRDYSHRRNERVGAKFENELPEAQANLTRLLKTRTNVRKSPRLTMLKKASPGAFKSYIFAYLFMYMCCNNLFICAFKSQALFVTLDACS